MMPPVSPGRACHAPVTVPLQSSLTQIKKCYAVEWQGLALSVESGVDCWTLRVRICGDSKPVYEAHRGTLTAAEVAGVEFAMFHIGGSALGNPERLAGVLAWNGHWGTPRLY